MKKRLLLPIFASFMIFTGVGANDVYAATVSDLTNTAKDYIGAPYLFGGTNINTGVDCSAYTQFVFSKLDISLERTSRAQYQQGTPVSKSNLQAGDLVFFNTSGTGISHVGIYIGNGNFISATPSSGVRIDKLNDPYYWGSRYIGAKRVANFTTTEKAEVKNSQVDFSIYASRGEVALQLAKALGLDTSDTNSPFPDVKSTSKYAGAVTALNKLGIFNGDQSGKFNPNSPITRGQLAIVLVKAFELEELGKAEKFSDVSSAHYAYEYVTILSSNGITSGKPDGTFGVGDKVKLIHLKIFLDRLTQ
ncbi:peptidase [Ureibacillus massiliensis 4400831 = CIP 108448 = CCUG 49529]|uniref:Peptidase n=1 Tax=Ureibacillus massiliensis 4400831 = CIP 108448 = CCUG 49529 TaxID=1211035 RepID=A0A0A3J1Z0_9BACL|nr:C40 family peptidase [Ureibacillus massiliensis]KGR89715.1 peptidase [Ureibacillus massiliensis 4400831 = CIP 108448 = CCUG 49529]